MTLGIATFIYSNTRMNKLYFEKQTISFDHIVALSVHFVENWQFNDFDQFWKMLLYLSKS